MLEITNWFKTKMRAHVTIIQTYRKIGRLVLKQNMSIREKEKSQCQCLKVQNRKNIVFKNISWKLCLKQHHKQTRIDWAWKYMSHGDKWLIAFFRVEKRNLNVHDDWNCYRHNIRKQPITFFCRWHGAKFLMVRGQLALMVSFKPGTFGVSTVKQMHTRMENNMTLLKN